MPKRMTEKRRIAILGSTGSIGKQALDVISQHSDLLTAEVLTANTQADELIRQALLFKPNCVVIGDKNLYPQVKNALSETETKVFAGSESLDDVVQMDCVDMVLTAVVGFAGLSPTIKAIESGKTIALSNKETLVVGGEYISRLAIERKVVVLPVDSEHSAVFQCLNGEVGNAIRTIYLTASGGPFRRMSRADMENVTVEQALRHPNWSMGRKVTIDSASMMNKGLEMIEAKWLFGVEAKQIKAVIHPQSIIHSMVEFEDGCLKAQLGVADMRLPIQYALMYPDRLPNNSKPFNPFENDTLTFEQPDFDRFPCLALAYEAIERGGNMPAVMNAANEVAVQAFLDGRIRFTQIADIIAKAMNTFSHIEEPSLEDYFMTDREVRTELQNEYK